MNLFRRIIALVMLPLMVFSSTGFSFDVHYCRGEIKSVGLFEAEKCKVEDEKVPPCHQNKMKCHKLLAEKGASSAQKLPCCHNETFIYAVDSEMEVSEHDWTSDQTTPVLVAVLMTHFWFQYETADIEPVYDYRPPPQIFDLPVLLQVFRI